MWIVASKKNPRCLLGTPGWLYGSKAKAKNGLYLVGHFKNILNLTLYKIDAMMDGDITDLLNALAAEHQADLLAAMGDA